MISKLHVQAGIGKIAGEDGKIEKDGHITGACQGWQKEEKTWDCTGQWN